MKIKKISKIENVLSYSFFEWDQINPDKGNNPNPNMPEDIFKKNNIIFAENGNGKTKFVDILKKMNEGNPNIEKHRDKLLDQQEIEVLLENNSTVSLTNNWINNPLKQKFIFFDKYFTNRFVHSTGLDLTNDPLRKQQRGENIIYLGKFAKYNQEINKIIEIKNEINILNKDFTIKKRLKIESFLQKNNITEQDLIDKRSTIKDIDSNDLQKNKENKDKYEDELEKIIKSLKNKTRISLLKLLINKDNECQGKINPNKIFSFTVSNGVQKTLKKIIHKNDFIKEGLSLIPENDKNCPFCEQKIKDNDYIEIIKDYQNIFNKTFLKEEEDTRNLLLRYKGILENLKKSSSSNLNKNYIVEAKEFITIEIDLPEYELNLSENKIIDKELNLVKNKESKILEEIEGSQFSKIEKIIEKYNKNILNYNNIVKKINTIISTLKKNSSSDNLAKRKIKLEELIKNINQEIVFIENKDLLIEYFTSTDKEENNNKIITKFEKIYQLMKTKIVEEFNKFITDYFLLIQTLVKEISPSMDILEITGSGNFNRSNRNPALCGFEIKYNGNDCSETLSEGEKQVIALAYFFAHLRKENDKEKIIVFDDPITSFDAGKRKMTSELIERETESFSQTFVLTCDPLFREYCLKQIKDRNFYYILKTRGSSAIHYTPKNKETIHSSFESDFTNIENWNGTIENVVIFGQKLRFCLETKIKEDYFGYSKDTLSEMIETIASNGKLKIDKLIDNKVKILQIYNYCNTGGLAHYPRDGATSWNELKAKIKDYQDLEL